MLKENKLTSEKAIILWTEGKLTRDEAFSVLYNNNYNKLFSHLNRTTFDPNTVEDIIQITFLVAFLKIDQWDKNTLILPWLYKISQLTQLKFIHKEMQRARDTTYGTPTASQLGHNDYGIIELQDEIEKRMRHLHSSHKRAVQDRYYNCKSIRTIAREENVSTQTIRQRLKKALTRMQTI